MAASIAEFSVIGRFLAAFGTPDHAPLASSKLQYSTTKYHLVTIFQFVELVAAELAAARDIGAVQAAEIAAKIVAPAQHDLRMTPRHAFAAVRELFQIDIEFVGCFLRPSDHGAHSKNAELEIIAARDQLRRRSGHIDRAILAVSKQFARAGPSRNRRRIFSRRRSRPRA